PGGERPLEPLGVGREPVGGVGRLSGVLVEVEEDEADAVTARPPLVGEILGEDELEAAVADDFYPLVVELVAGLREGEAGVRRGDVGCGNDRRGRRGRRRFLPRAPQTGGERPAL